MPFEPANALGVFQELMSTILQRQEHHVLSYLEDTFVFFDSVEHHLEHIQMIFNSLRKHDLKLKASKSEFV